MNRYVLVDKRGKNRGTCEAKHFAAAEKAFVKQRGGRAIPEGWGIEIRPNAAMKRAFAHLKQLSASPSPARCEVKVTTKDLPQVQRLLGEAQQTIKEQAEKIARLQKDVSRAFADAESALTQRDELAEENIELEESLHVANNEVARVTAVLAQQREHARFAAAKLSDVHSLLRSWEIQGATTVTAVVYGLKRVLDRKD